MRLDELSSSSEEEEQDQPTKKTASIVGSWKGLASSKVSPETSSKVATETSKIGDETAATKTAGEQDKHSLSTSSSKESKAEDEPTKADPLIQGVTENNESSEEHSVTAKSADVASAASAAKTNEDDID